MYGDETKRSFPLKNSMPIYPAEWTCNALYWYMLLSVFFPISGNLLFLMVVPPDLMLLHLFWHFCSDWWGLYRRETKGRCSKCMTNSSCWCKGFWIMRDGMLWVLSWTTLWDQWLGFVVGAWTKSLGLTRLCCDIMFSFAGQFELDLANAVWWMCSIALS
jgi:hypothetical protein